MENSLQNYIGYWVKQLYRDTANMYDSKLSQYGLTTALVNVLAYLWSSGDGLAQKELQELVNVKPASITNFVDTLAEGGWVVRKASAEDGRAKWISLTEKGKEIEKVCRDIINEIEESMQMGFSHEEISLMLSWFKKIHKNFHLND